MPVKLIKTYEQVGRVSKFQTKYAVVWNPLFDKRSLSPTKNIDRDSLPYSQENRISNSVVWI